jgi:hypothetical protein
VSVNSQLLEAQAFALARRRAAEAGIIRPRKAIDYSPHKPTERQQLFLNLDDLEAFYGGAAGGGKTDALLMAALKYVDVPGYSALLLMKTFADLSKPKALMDRAHEWLSGTGARWRGDLKRWEFPNASGPPATLDFGYCQTDADKYNYRTAEYQFIGIDELTRFQKQTYTYLFSRLRRLKTASHVPIRMRPASNPAQPGEPGMQWVEERFIPDDFDPELEAGQAPRVLSKNGIDERTGRIVKRHFVFARLEDNPYLDAEEYDLSLSELDAVSYEQLRKGDWKIRQRGDIYWMFDPRYVFVPWNRWAAVIGVNHIPDHWGIAVSQDQGTSDEHIGATGWFATAAKNSPVQDLVAMYRALMVVERSPTEVGDAILTLMGVRPEAKEKANIEDGIQPDHYGGIAERSRVSHWLNSHEAKSERLEYRKMGINFSSWTAGPNIGIAQMRNYLAIIDRDKPNPFFPDLMGRSRFVCVVPNEDWPRRRPDSVWARVEAEFFAYHYKKLSSGEPTTDVAPHPLFNDFMDVIKAAAFTSFPAVKPLTLAEANELKLRPEIRLPAIRAEDNEVIQQAKIQTRDLYLKRIAAEQSNGKHKLVIPTKIRFRR